MSVDKNDSSWQCRRCPKPVQFCRSLSGRWRSILLLLFSGAMVLLYVCSAASGLFNNSIRRVVAGPADASSRQVSVV